MAALVSKHFQAYLQHDTISVKANTPKIFFTISSVGSGAQVQSLMRTSPTRDIHIAQVETLMKDKEGISLKEFLM